MVYTIIFSSLCFVLSCLGASVVFFIKNEGQKIDAVLHAFASGVMIASSIFSLIIPAIDYCNELNMPHYFILPMCFIFAAAFFLLVDKLFKSNDSTKINKKMLVAGLTLHNIPEGMCVGFAFASASIANTKVALMAAVMIALGIGIQNIPEGSAVSFPLYSSGETKARSFFTAFKASIVEIPAGMIAYVLGLNFISVLPFMLAFSAATMITVACTDLMPEAVSKNKTTALISLIVGFIVMMFLDLALG